MVAGAGVGALGGATMGALTGAILPNISASEGAKVGATMGALGGGAAGFVQKDNMMNKIFKKQRKKPSAKHSTVCEWHVLLVSHKFANVNERISLVSSQ